MSQTKESNALSTFSSVGQHRSKIIWTIYALVYDVLLVLKPYTDTLRNICDALVEHNVHVVLDVGCGTGNLTLFAKNYGISSVWGIDSSQTMLWIAKLKKRLWKLSSCYFLQADLNDEKTLPQRKFDAVVALGVLHAVQDPQKTVGKLVKYLNPSGILVIVQPLPVSIKGIILEHIRSAGFWRLVLSILLLPFFAISLVINLIEEAWNKQHLMHFLTTDETKSIIEKTGLHIEVCKLTFGDAYTLVIGRVSSDREAG